MTRRRCSVRETANVDKDLREDRPIYRIADATGVRRGRITSSEWCCESRRRPIGKSKARGCERRVLRAR